MANKVKGEVGFKVDGQDYTLLLDLNALCEAEDHVPGIMDGGLASMKSIKAIRAVFWSGLQGHHPDVTLIKAGQIMQALGVPKAGQLIGEAMSAAWGDNKGGEGADSPQ